MSPLVAGWAFNAFNFVVVLIIVWLFTPPRRPHRNRGVMPTTQKPPATLNAAPGVRGVPLPYHLIQYGPGVTDICGCCGRPFLKTWSPPS